jgi:lysyl-tRNA synthetase, class II
MPVRSVGGWSLDMMRRLTTAPNGLNEFMLIQSARMLRAEGYQFMSLNFAALSNTEAFVLEPRALTSLRRFCFDNLSWLFQMKSLYRFNAKFQPTWESRYLAFRDLKSIGKIVMAIIQSEDPIELPRIVRSK